MCWKPCLTSRQVLQAAGGRRPYISAKACSRWAKIFGPSAALGPHKPACTEPHASLDIGNETAVMDSGPQQGNAVCCNDGGANLVQPDQRLGRQPIAWGERKNLLFLRLSEPWVASVAAMHSYGPQEANAGLGLQLRKGWQQLVLTGRESVVQ